jgi:hypothetical protein
VRLFVALAALAVGACATSPPRPQRIEIPEIRRPPPSSGRSGMAAPRSERACQEGLAEPDAR